MDGKQFATACSIFSKFPDFNCSINLKAGLILHSCKGKKVSFPSVKGTSMRSHLNFFLEHFKEHQGNEQGRVGQRPIDFVKYKYFPYKIQNDKFAKKYT